LPAGDVAYHPLNILINRKKDENKRRNSKQLASEIYRARVE
jgi:hypothetical protein